MINSTKTSQDGHGGSFQIDYLGNLLGAQNQAVIGSTFDFGDTNFTHYSQDGEVDGTRGVSPEADESAVLHTQLTATNDYYGLFFTDTFSPKPWFNLTGSVRWNHADIKLNGITVDDENETETKPNR